MQTRLNRLTALRAITALAVLTLAALAAAACGSGKEDPTAEATPIPPETVLENTRTAMAAVEQFEFELSHPKGRTALGGGLALRRAEGAVISPDRLSLDAEAEFGTIFVSVQARVIGDQTWMTNPLTGNWAAVDAGESPLSFLDPPQLVADVLAELDGVSYPASGPARSGPIILEGTVEAAALSALVGSVEEGSVLNVRLTVDRQTYRLNEALITGRLQTGDAPDAARLIRLSGFDSAITIEPPV